MNGKIRKALARAEGALREALGFALEEGDYSTVARLGELANETKRLRGLPESSMAQTLSTPKTMSATPRPHKSKSPAFQPGAKSTSFHREGRSLVKTAKSSAASGSYQHRADWGVVESLASALTAAGDQDLLFRMDEVLPLSFPEGGRVPDYQAYLALAWLRNEGLVIQHGRRGYSVPRPPTLLSEARSVFNRLQTG